MAYLLKVVFIIMIVDGTQMLICSKCKTLLTEGMDYKKTNNVTVIKDCDICKNYDNLHAVEIINDKRVKKMKECY